MRKFLSFLLSAVTFCTGLIGCGSQPKVQTPQRNENMPKQLLVSDVTGIPIATDDMTYAERRQLCLDYFRLQLSFQWISNMDITDYPTTYFEKGSSKQLLTSEIYGGIPYQSKGTGNLYRWLEYYDESTGIMDLQTALAENGGYGKGAVIFDEKYDADGNITYKKYRSFTSLFNQCSVSSFWGWGRVINSVRFGFTNYMTAYNGMIPVGCYSYGYEHNGTVYDMTSIDVFGENTAGNPTGYDTPDVIRDWRTKNGADAIFECYAQLKPADLLVDTGHVRMVKSVNLFTTKDGEVDYELSSITCLDQIESWGEKGKLGDKDFKNQGGIDKIYSFRTLMEDEYIPFTFLELLDPNDEQDKKHLDYYDSYKDKLVALRSCFNVLPYIPEDMGGGVEKAKVYSTLDKTEGSISYLEFRGMTVGSNYAISDVFVTVTGKDGTQLLKNIYRADIASIREVSMDANKCTWETTEGGRLLALYDGVKELATGENTIEISLQLSSGEKLTAFKGTLTAK